MRKYLIASLSTMMLLSACKKKVDQVFDQTPDARLTTVINAFQDKLVKQTDGWKVLVKPLTPGSYPFYMKFTNANRVTMLSDISDSAAGVPRESSYRLKALQQPTIIFDTYNYLHVLMDPTPAIAGADYGVGLVSDIEYYFPTALVQALQGTKPDTINTMALKGRYNGADIVFTKASAAEASSYMAGDLKKLRVAVNNYSTVNRHRLYLDFGDGIKILVTIDLTNRTVSFFWIKNGTAFTFTSTFYFTLDALQLGTPFSYNGTSIISKISWDNVKLTAAGTGTPLPVQIAGSDVYPLHVLIGTTITGINLPAVTSFPGWSDDFKARRAAVATALINGPYGLTLDEMDFSTFTPNRDTLFVVVYQGNNGFLAQFNYTYTKTAGGVYKFTMGATSGNAALIVNNMAPLLGQRINVDNFTVDYYYDPVEGELAQFTSVQHPDFAFTGRMR
jgi:hypothetical protein